MTFGDIPAGASLFVDANTFVYQTCVLYGGAEFSRDERFYRRFLEACCR